jgi:hypothetical protein
MADILQCTPMRDAETNTPPAFAMPPGACDTHFHVFEPDYPHVRDPLYTFPDGTLDAYLRMAEVLGIERMILVQPSFLRHGQQPARRRPRAPGPALRRRGPDRRRHQRNGTRRVPQARRPRDQARPGRPRRLAGRGAGACSPCSARAAAGSSCPGRTGWRRAGRSALSHRSAGRWSPPGRTGCSGARTGRTCRMGSATPARC